MTSAMPTKAIASGKSPKKRAPNTTAQMIWLYWNGATVDCMQRIRALREDAGEQVFFTVDAGAQVKAVCTPDAAPRVAAALAELPGVAQVLSSRLGEGARLLDDSEAP